MKPKYVSKRQWERSVDCYDLKTGDKYKFNNHYLAAEYYSVSPDAVYVALDLARPIIESRYYLIYSDESVKNRRFVLASQMSHYQLHSLPDKERINELRRISAIYIQHKDRRHG